MPQAPAPEAVTSQIGSPSGDYPANDDEVMARGKVAEANEPNISPTPPTTYSELLPKLLNDRANLREEKPPGWQQAAYLGLQAVANYFNGTNNPIVPLAQARMQEKMGAIDRRIAPLEQARQYKHQRKVEDQTYRKGESVIENTRVDNQRMQDDLERKRIADDRKYEIQVRTADWKEEDKKKYWEWEDVKLKARERKDAATAAMAERKQDEIERSNKAKEGIQRKAEAGRGNRQQIAIEARKSLAEYNKAAAEGRQKDAQAHRERMAQLKAEYENAQ
jgi:hypothetical protein